MQIPEPKDRKTVEDEHRPWFGFPRTSYELQIQGHDATLGNLLKQQLETYPDVVNTAAWRLPHPSDPSVCVHVGLHNPPADEKEHKRAVLAVLIRATADLLAIFKGLAHDFEDGEQTLLP